MINPKMVTVLVSISTMMIFAGSMMSNHNAEAIDTYEKTGFTLTHNPMICVTEPTPTTLFPALNVELSRLSENGIGDWYTALNDSSQKNGWSIFHGTIPYDNTSTAKSFSCDITITFLPSPTFSPDQEEPVGLTTYDFAHHTAKIEIYYLALKTQIHTKTVLNAYVYYWYTFTGYDQNNIAQEYQILQAINHELGHAFGLGHHIAGDSPSVMTPLLNNADGLPTEADVQELKSLYGANGFNSPIQPQPVSQSYLPVPTQLPTPNTVSQSTPTILIPAKVKSNAKDWSDGTMDDDGFAKVLRWLGFENAIKLPDTSAGSEWKTVIPSWVKKDTKLWIRGNMTDNDYFSALQYLLDNKIITLNQYD